MAGYRVTAAAVQVKVGSRMHLVLAGGLLPDGVDGDVVARLVGKGMVVEVGDHAEPEPDPAEDPDDDANESKSDLGSMNLDQLRTYAAYHGVDLGDATRKADIIAVIEAA